MHTQKEDDDLLVPALCSSKFGSQAKKKLYCVLSASVDNMEGGGLEEHKWEGLEEHEWVPDL